MWRIRKLIFICILYVCFQKSKSSRTTDCYNLCFGVDGCIHQCQHGIDHKPNEESKSASTQEVPTSNAIQSYAFINEFPPSVASFDEMNSISTAINLPHCGLRFGQGTASYAASSDGLKRIVGGEDADLHEFPWIVTLQIKRGGEWRHFCGGSVINEYFVLTAAHCTQPIRGQESQVIVKFGVNSVHSEEGQVVRADKFIIHKGWDKMTQNNDISLIRVKEPFRFLVNNQNQYTANTICLPYNKDEPVGFAKLAGWGQTAENRPTAEWLQKITLRLWNRADCIQQYKQFLEITDKHICSGGRGGEDSCMGDSGGPLIQVKDGRAYQIGLVSFGIPCAIKNYPGVYTRVSHYMDWILSNMY